jgi:hypothetical protein
MGIDIVGFHSFLKGLLHTKNYNNILTLGRQGLDINLDIANHIAKQYNIYFQSNYPFVPWEEFSPNKAFCERMLTSFGFKNVDSIDFSDYEKASIIHDLNKPIPTDLKKYDYILDGGTVEHIFNAPQVYENIFNLLEVNGIYVSIACNNNYSGHGFYQYSPDFYASIMQNKYGMELLELKLAKLHTEPKDWHDVSVIHMDYNGRNIFHFDTNTPVYIVCVARKISNERASLILEPPMQYSYQEVLWKQPPK